MKTITFNEDADISVFDRDAPDELPLPVVTQLENGEVEVKMATHLHSDQIQVALMGGGRDDDDDDIIPLLCVQQSYGESGLFTAMDLQRAKDFVKGIERAIETIESGKFDQTARDKLAEARGGDFEED